MDREIPLAAIEARTREAVAGGANVIMMSKGMIRVAQPAFSPTTSLALLLSASASPDGGRPQVVQIAEVEEALTLGADCVVLFTALGGDTEAGMIEILAAVGRECALLGMPFIAEAEFPTTYATVEELKQQYGFEYLRRNVRLCAELGADIVKTNWPGDPESFAKLVEATSGIPVVLAGGSRLSDEELLRRMEHAMAAGAIMGVWYVICATLVALMPSLAMKLFSYMVHLVNLEAGVSGFPEAIYGFIEVIVLTYVTAYVFAWLHNRFMKTA